jgi:hypothetical protein
VLNVGLACLGLGASTAGETRNITMVDRWDNIEILQAIDRRQQETYRGGLCGVSTAYI